MQVLNIPSFSLIQVIALKKLFCSILTATETMISIKKKIMEIYIFEADLLRFDNTYTCMCLNYYVVIKNTCVVYFCGQLND